MEARDLTPVLGALPYYKTINHNIIAIMIYFFDYYNLNGNKYILNTTKY